MKKLFVLFILALWIPSIFWGFWAFAASWDTSSYESETETGSKITDSDEEKIETIIAINTKLFEAYKVIIDKKLKKIDTSIADLPDEVKIGIYKNLIRSFEKTITKMQTQKNSRKSVSEKKPADVILEVYIYMKKYYEERITQLKLSEK
jgi:hypothetical protein